MVIIYHGDTLCINDLSTLRQFPRCNALNATNVFELTVTATRSRLDTLHVKIKCGGDGAQK